MNLTEQEAQCYNRLLDNLVGYFNTVLPEQYPLSMMVLEVGHVTVINQQEMAGRCKMLCDLLNIGNELSIKANDDGRLIPFFVVRRSE